MVKYFQLFGLNDPGGLHSINTSLTVPLHNILCVLLPVINNTCWLLHPLQYHSLLFFFVSFLFFITFLLPFWHVFFWWNYVHVTSKRIIYNFTCDASLIWVVYDSRIFYININFWLSWCLAWRVHFSQFVHSWTWFLLIPHEFNFITGCNLLYLRFFNPRTRHFASFISFFIMMVLIIGVFLF